ncbi:MAG: muconolactone Delta-isomerase family protein [Sphingobacteriaceae bacterium]
MNRIGVIFTINTENLPSDFQEIIKHEQEVIQQWKEAGYLDHMYLRQSKNGAVLVFKDVDEAKVNELMQSLPLYKLKKSIEVLPLIKQF